MSEDAAPTTALVGREEEMATLAAAWSAAGRMVALHGVAGVGKSRLVHELLDVAARSGGQVLTGRCSSAGRDVPLRPIAEVLLGAARSGRRPPPSMAAFVPALGRLVPEWASSVDADSSALVLGEAVVRFAASLSSPSAPTVLAIEDVQWADPDTVTLLEYLADAVTGQPVLVVVTCRAGETGAGTDLIEQLASGRRVTIIDVTPLDADGVATLARSQLGLAELPDGLVATLTARTDGVPFLVEEMLATDASADELERVLPASVLASVQARVAALPDDAAELVRCAAVLGRDFRWEVAAEAAGVGSVAAGGALRAATAAQLLERDGGGFRFRHALTRDAVLADLTEWDRAGLSRRALAALEGLDPELGDDHLATAAELAAVAGDRPHAAALSARGARRALAGGSLVAAETLARRAVDLDGEHTPEHALLLLSVWNQAGKFDEVRALSSRLRQSTGGDILAEACTALAMAEVRAERSEEADAAIAAARSASDDPARSARLEVLAAQAALVRSDVATALTLARRATTAADAVTACEALEVIGRVERLRDPTEAERAFEEARRLAGDQGMRTWEIRALQELGTIDMYTTLSTARLRAARDEAERAGAVSIVAVVDLQLAALHGERLELDEAVAAAVRSQDASRRFGLSTLPMAIALEGMAHGKAGRRGALEDAAARARATGNDQVNVEIAVWGNGWAPFHLHRVERRAALDALDRSMPLIRQASIFGTPISGLWALLATALDAPHAGDARDELRELELDTPMSQAMARSADAIAAGDRGDRDRAQVLQDEADTVLRRYERGYRLHLTRWLVAPRAHVAGWGRPESWLRESLAGFEQLGLDGLARSCREELRGLGVAVPRARADATVPAALAGLGITGRELDVLQLLGEGLGNREIAERLYLSPRTVEKHVERLKQKTDRDRAGLATLIGEAALD